MRHASAGETGVPEALRPFGDDYDIYFSSGMYRARRWDGTGTELSTVRPVTLAVLLARENTWWRRLARRAPAMMTALNPRPPRVPPYLTHPRHRHGRRP
jgi:hypothetical protein